MAFDCNNCLASCRADCCHGPVPMEKDWFAKQKLIRPVIAVQEIGDNMVAPLAIDERTGGGVCPLLGLDDKCSVYAERPFVCKKFGDETSMFMTCSYQAKDGRVRSRQERRHIERKLFKQRDQVLARLQNDIETPEDVQVMEKTAEDWLKSGGKLPT